MVPKLVLLFSFSLLLNLNTALAAEEDIVDTGYAKYLGNRTFSNAVAYLGIPYAEPPVGDRRFRAPAPLDTARIAEESSGEVVDATKYPEFCIQGPISADNLGGAGSEDCLKMNIYAPSGAKKGDQLPVLVYFPRDKYQIIKKRSKSVIALHLKPLLRGEPPSPRFDVRIDLINIYIVAADPRGGIPQFCDYILSAKDCQSPKRIIRAGGGPARFGFGARRSVNKAAR
ncbi:hypothetical protein PQX77_015819, partial [Marasmius sp. AFHP31]